MPTRGSTAVTKKMTLARRLDDKGDLTSARGLDANGVPTRGSTAVLLPTEGGEWGGGETEKQQTWSVA
jgi:hypothetical protein